MSIDYNKLSSAVDSPHNRVGDSRNVDFTTLRKLKTKKSLGVNKRAAFKVSKRFNQVNDSVKGYRSFGKIKDSLSYLSLKKRIKDALSETESTEEAIQAIEQIAQDKPADIVIPAVVEVLGETVELLESAIDSSSINVSSDLDEDGLDDKEEIAYESSDEISDSNQDLTAIIRKAYEQLPMDKRYLNYKQLESDDKNYYVTFIDPTPSLPGEDNEKYEVIVPIKSLTKEVSDFSIGDYYEGKGIEGVITGITYGDNCVTLLVDVQDESGYITPTEVYIPL